LAQAILALGLSAKALRAVAALLFFSTDMSLNPDFSALRRLRIVALQRTCEAQPCARSIRDPVKRLIWSFLQPALVGYEASATTVAGGRGLGGGASQLRFPEGIALARDGSLLVADVGNHRVQRVPAGSCTGVTVAGGRGMGPAPDQLSSPRSVAVCPDGCLLVADATNGRVQRFEPGSTTGAIAAGADWRIPDAPNELRFPVDVAIAPDGEFFVADSQSGCVWRVGAERSLSVAASSSPGRDGATAMQLIHMPCAVVVAPDGGLFMAERMGHRVLRFAPGSPQGDIAAGGCGRGTAARQLDQPSALALRSDGALLVADAANHRVQLFALGSEEGVTVAGTGVRGTGAEQLHGPAGVLLAPDGALLVSDSGNHRVQRFAALHA